MEAEFSTEWDSDNADYRAIFNAALSGICANPNFFGSIMQQQPEAAVWFANEVVLAAIYGDKYVPPYSRTAPRERDKKV